MNEDFSKKAMLSTAYMIAAAAHDGQYDKGGNPYFSHPLKVMHYTRSDDPEIQTIAVLHDVVEDTPWTFEQLKEVGMSDRVINALKVLTKMSGQTNRGYINGIKKNRDAVIVKLADLRHNMDPRRLKGLTEKDFERMEKYQSMYFELKNDS